MEAALSGTRCRRSCSARISGATCTSHTTATDGKDDIETMARAASAAGLEYLASPITVRRWRWPTDSTRPPRSTTPARIRATQRTPRGHHAAGRHRVRHPPRRHARSGRRLSRAARLRGRLGALGLRARTRGDDRPSAARHRVPVGRRHRTPDRPAAAAARAAALRRRRRAEGRDRARHRARDQLPGRSARCRRHGGAPRPRPRGIADRVERLALGPELRRLDWGIGVAKRAWATSGNILNTRPLAELQKSLRRNRQGRPSR